MLQNKEMRLYAVVLVAEMGIFDSPIVQILHILVTGHPQMTLWGIWSKQILYIWVKLIPQMGKI